MVEESLAQALLFKCWNRWRQRSGTLITAFSVVQDLSY